MNETLTPMGSRLLRSNILQPSTQPDVLNSRYDAVQELSCKEDMFVQVRQGRNLEFLAKNGPDYYAALTSFTDIEKLLTTVYASFSPPYFVYGSPIVVDHYPDSS